MTATEFSLTFSELKLKWRRSLPLIAVLLIQTILVTAAAAPQTSSSTVVLRVKGIISVSTSDYIEEGLSYARETGSGSLIILLDTPGGSLDATLEIIRLIGQSEIPVITFVYPSGATGWSAGVFILLSSHVAAMAPGTVIGSSQPRAFPWGELISDPKIVNALAELLAERARLHGRNETAAAKFVTENLNVGAENAALIGVVDATANSIESLMDLIDGREVKISGRGRVKLHTSGVNLLFLGPSIRSRILGFLSEPTFAYILFTLGLWIMIFGLSTTGPTGEVLGGILLILGLIGLGLNVDVLTVLLLLAGGTMVVLEMREPGLQVFGPAGIVSIMLGSLLLLRLDPSRWLVSREWYTLFFLIVVGVAATMTGLATIIFYKVFKLPRRRTSVGEVVGEVGRAIDDLGPGREGYVQTRGEYWRARANTHVGAGQRVRIVAKEGAVLFVEPAEKA